MTLDDRVPALRALLGDHEAADDRERRAVATTLETLDRLARPFDREADRVHVTASALVLGPRGILLHRHRRLGIWMQPGGHVDPGEEPHDAAARETVEETGVTASHPAQGPRLLHVDVHEVAHNHTHLDLRYMLVAGDDEPAPADGESPEVAWFTRDQAVAIADPGLAGALRALHDSPWAP